MDDIASFVWRLAPDWLADLFRAPLWKALMGVVIATLCLAGYSALPAAARDRVKLVAIFATLVFAALELVPPLEQGAHLG